MATTSIQKSDYTRPSLSFHDGYIAVIYGLVATKGLEHWVELISQGDWNFTKPPYFVLFLGTFAAGLHFWFTCAAVESPAASFYALFVGQKWARLFLIGDALMATAFAGIVMAMFAAIPNHEKTLFRWFAFAAIVSLTYDLYSAMLLLWCAKRPECSEDSRLVDYRRGVRQWFIQDGVFLGVALLALFVAGRNNEASLAAQILFLAGALSVLCLDVQFSRPESRDSKHWKA
jgi:hypothetical protein